MYAHDPGESEPPNPTVIHTIYVDAPGTSLESSFIRVLNGEGDNKAYETYGTFFYDPDDPRFDEFMVYFHAQRRFLTDFLYVLEYDIYRYLAEEGQITARVHYPYVYGRWAGAGADPPSNLLWFTHEGPWYRYPFEKNDLAKESDVIYHEYMHLVTYDLVGGWLYDPGQEKAMNEAYSDFMACSFDDNPRFEQYTIPGINTFLRTCDNTYTMDEHWDYWDWEEDHNRSQIYSGALWDLRESLGIYSFNGRYIAEILALESLSHLDTDSNFLDGKDAMLASDILRFGGAHLLTIRSTFHSRDIGEELPSAPSFTWARWEQHYELMALHLKWTRNPDIEVVTRYKLERATGAGPFSLRAYVSQPSSGSIVEFWDYISKPAEEYRYRVCAENAYGFGPYSEIIHVYTVGGGGGGPERVALDIERTAPDSLVLDPNYPNPFYPSTQIKFGLPSTSHVRLQIMNVRGQTVRVLVDEEKPAGWFTVTWDGKNESGREVASGIYLYLIEADNKKILKRLTFIR